MSLVVLEQVGLEFGGRTLCAGLDLRVGESDRIGVVGRNGAGKSSLLKIVAGTLEPTSGRVRRARGLRIGYLPQELTVEGGKALLDSVRMSVPGRRELERELEVVEEDLAAATEEDEQIALSGRLADLHESLAHFDARWSVHEAERILVGLGFAESDFGRDLSELSGGWRMRAVLAALLFQQPDLLLLDEPTNHLDVPSMTWLAGFLARRRGAFLLICHDREFLDEQVRRVVAFEAEAVRQVDGNYTDYCRARAEELKVLERRAANLAREREAAERFIRRFRAQASKARAVQSRIKALERLDEIEIPQAQAALTFRFPPCKRAGNDVVRLEGVGHRYGSHRVFSDVNTVVRRGERIAVVGANGNGKTTLLRILAGRLEPTEGRVQIGHNVTVGYYAQHVGDELDRRSTVFEEVWRHSQVEDLSTVRTALGTMLFSGDDVDKVIGVLSGGEKARVALARLLVCPGNLLLMDEPTNHLDLESAEALAAALETFDGTLIFVSHNRSFVNRLATRIWDVSGGRVEEFPGTLAEYMDHCARIGRQAAGESPAGGDGRAVSGRATREQGESGADAPAGRRRRLRQGKTAGGGAGSRSKQSSKRRQAKIAELEERIAALERAQAERSRELSKPETYADQARYGELLGAYQSDAAKIEELMARWERAQSDE
ncbi:MAG: ABC transporter ATP-binding protein [Deltaproteobacteria bacterium]|nr:MAG: ABC transporter ATP-binding protein [Deltaproteobacteria bacterium]